MPEEVLRPERQGDVTILSLGPRYEALNEPVMQNTRELLLKLAVEVDPPKLLFDFRNTRYFDSMMVELLFRVWNPISRRKGQFAFCNLQEFPSKVIRTARLDTLWGIYPSREDALDAMMEKKE